MVDATVTLPEPGPEDDEDVVWGLSTAAALWARGERGDAIVWLRRAADAAAAAGQEARAAEIGTSVVRIGLVVERLQHQAAPPTPVPFDASSPVDEPIAIPPPSPPFTSGGVGADRSAPGPVHDGPAPAPLGPQPTIRPPPAPRPRPASMMPPPSGGASPSKPPLTADAPSRTATTLPKTSSIAPPPATSTLPANPGGPPVLRPHAAARQAPRPPSAPPPAPLPSGTPPAGRPSAAPPPHRVTAPSSYPGARKTAGPRIPILDPWADELALPNLRVEAVLRPVQIEGDDVLVQMRGSAPSAIEEDDGVITSAAPLDHTLRRMARPPTPPTRRWTLTGEQPPGYIADVSTGVAPKVPPAGKPRPPAPLVTPSPQKGPTPDSSALEPDGSATVRRSTRPTPPAPESGAGPDGTTPDDGATSRQAALHDPTGLERGQRAEAAYRAIGAPTHERRIATGSRPRCRAAVADRHLQPGPQRIESRIRYSTAGPHGVAATGPFGGTFAGRRARTNGADRADARPSSAARTLAAGTCGS